MIGLTASSYAQKIIPASTRVDTASNFAAGTYRFYMASGDTVDMTIALPVIDSIKIPCPICKVYTKADTLAIQALKVCAVCPAPVICPVCPPTKQRTAISIGTIISATKQSITITYDDGTVSVLQ